MRLSAHVARWIPGARLTCALLFATTVACPGAAQARTGEPTSCKPSAPIRLALEEIGRAGTNVQLRLSLEPLLPMLALEWELELPEDTLLARGQRFGTADGRVATTSTHEATLSMPTHQAYRRVTLVARGVFEGADDDGNTMLESVVAMRTLTYGTPAAVGPIVTSPGTEDFEAGVELPTRRHTQRRSGWTPVERRDVRPAQSAAATFLVTGVFEYEDKAWGFGGWTGADPILPIREADVTVLDNLSSAVLGTGSTAADGSFSIDCTSAGVTDVRVRVNADTNLSTFQHLRVTTTNNLEYTAFSTTITGHDTTLDLDVGSTTVLKSLSGAQEGNPFNCLDQGVDMWSYLTGPLVGAGNVGTVRIIWPGGSGSFASGSSANMADDDGYDDAVILHELGHVMHRLYSDSDNPGGSHFFGDSNQDPRLSMGEGFATFIAGVVLIEERGENANYFDGSGALQNGGAQLRLRLETASPFSNDARGAADEVAVACTLFDILDDEDSSDPTPGVDDDLFVSTTLINGATPHAAWWDAFTGPLASATDLTLNDAWNGWFTSHGAGGLHPELESLFALRRVDFLNDAAEPNNSVATATPITVTGTFSGNRTLYRGTGTPPLSGLNDRDWYALELVVGSVIDVETRYPKGAADADTQADCHLRLRSPSGVNTDTDTGGVGRNALFADFPITETGTWFMRVRSMHAFRDYGRYNYRVRYDFENLVPVILTGPNASPTLLGPNQLSTQLSVSASDAQALTHTWTPKKGGSIAGSGPNVTFTPPAVVSSKVFPVELVVTDTFGAASDPITVDVRVQRSYRPVFLPQAKKK